MKNLLKYFHDLTIHPKNAAELKGLILQLAVQGKLTVNWRLENPDVEPASVLLEGIKTKKAQLVKEGKIKKEKPLPEITVKEIPYELPKSWVWCRLDEACEYIQRGKSPEYTEVPKVPVVSQKCVQWSGFDISRAKFITEESLKKYGDERFLQEGDLLWNSTGDGTIGRVISYPKSDFEKVVADSHVTVVRAFKKYILTDYLWIFTASPLIQSLVAGRVSGSTKQTELGTGTIKLMEFSFPPLEEQKAIVSVVNQLFAEVEQLEALTKERIRLKEDFVTSALQQLTNSEKTNGEWAFLQQHFATFFTELPNIKKLRESILQLAVQGKLTTLWRSRHPELVSGSHSAEALLDRIKTDKAQLVKAGKIKKEKPLPKITAEEIPYELPEGWVWSKLGEVFEIVRGSSPRPKGDSRYWSENRTNHHWITIADFTPFSEKGFLTDTKEFLTDLGTNYSREVDLLDLLIACSGVGSVGRSVKLNIKGYIYDGIIAIRQMKFECLRDYISFFIQGKESEIYSVTTGGSWLNINTELVKNYIVAIPPLAEQRAIVEKVNTLMALCDQLEQEIQTSQSTREDWMKSSLREVFAGKKSI